MKKLRQWLNTTRIQDANVWQQFLFAALLILFASLVCSITVSHVKIIPKHQIRDQLLPMFNFFKKKPSAKQPITLEQYIQLRRDQGDTNEQIQKDLLGDLDKGGTIFGNLRNFIKPTFPNSKLRFPESSEETKQKVTYTPPPNPPALIQNYRENLKLNTKEAVDLYYEYLGKIENNKLETEERLKYCYLSFPLIESVIKENIEKYGDFAITSIPALEYVIKRFLPRGIKEQPMGTKEQIENLKLIVEYFPELEGWSEYLNEKIETYQNATPNLAYKGGSNGK